METRVSKEAIAMQYQNRNRAVGILFSKDRAMQLDAALKSFFLHCRDVNNIEMKVIYKASNPMFEGQYAELIGEYASVEFLQETDFGTQVLSSVQPGRYVLFLVDDNIFTRDFSLLPIMETLEHHTDALGFSLRLGRNTRYCYMSDHEQKLPDFHKIEHGFLKYQWVGAEHDFGYPLEVSSSLYRAGDLIPLLQHIAYSNPNTLEAQMAAHAYLYNGKRFLLCSECSVTFCNPANKVQSVYNNRGGTNVQYTIHELSRMFAKGIRIDVEKYAGFMPNACHQEVDLLFHVIKRG